MAEHASTSPADSLLDPTGELRELAGDCVHCGFCLPSCPTYQLWGEEMDSPRGRIHLITQILDSGHGTEAASTHFDRCLGCMACLPACPSGVHYDTLIEAARGWNAERGQPVAPLPARSPRDRAVRAAIFATFPYPRRMRALLAPLRAVQRTGLDKRMVRSKLVGRLAPEAVAALRLTPPLAPASRDQASQSRLTPARDQAPPARLTPAQAPPARLTPARRQLRLPHPIPARGPRRAVVAVLTGCVQQVFFPQVNAATARVLAAEGCDVIVPPTQGCCGALSLHGGRRAEAAAFAKKAIDVFELANVDAIIVNAAGCGSAMKDYPQVLAGSPGWAERAAAISAKVRDFSEFLAELGPAAPRSELPLTIAYHDACHLAYAQRVTAQPRSLLRAIPGVTLVDIADGGTCCGSAGIYNLVQPDTAAELGARKARAVHATAADLLVSANPGCSLQIARALADQGAALPVAHVAEVLDASIRSEPASALLRHQR